MQLEQNIEALIFASEQGIRIEEIIYCLQASLNAEVEEADITAAIQAIKQKYEADALAIELVKINNGYQFLTKKAYHQIISQLQLQRSKKKLSQAALETLAIIAYKQPVTKLEIEQIRGVNCDYSVQKLLEKELISITGKADTVGKPLLYGTSNLFADYMGIHSINELPSLAELSNSTNTIGNEQE
ncbi:SMC-Scp complex subunit ScpB [Mucilaginibacter terrae]|uniref:Segregation and condensation protein B n=1 Tax=Mucilaginibacter terrae TaxID=1955052 RepID=A0ABU3GPX2_9SPHI|nr:SMC-Scp complex subunit ScpB [Mucilaginibacter terrae]MDT3401833.1 segregation and condensation protein B [Mucilaginibacter terrae]